MFELMNNLIAQRVRLLENRVGFLEQKMAAAGSVGVFVPDDNRQCQRTGRKKFQSFYEKGLETIADLGLTAQQVDVLKQFGLLAVDNVTKFYEGRSGPARFETLKDAILHVVETGERAFYVTMDLQNLGGLNAQFGHTEANKVFARIARQIRKSLTAVGKDVILFRHGGDEMSAILFDTEESLLHAAFQKINREIQKIANRDGLNNLEHPKHPGDPRYQGIGLHVGIAEIKAEFANNPQEIFKIADMQLENDKRIESVSA